jgi:hypothetical protein
MVIGRAHDPHGRVEKLACQFRRPCGSRYAAKEKGGKEETSPVPDLPSEAELVSEITL